MIQKIKLFAQLCGYAAVICLSLFGLMALVGSGATTPVSAALDQSFASTTDNVTVPAAFNYQGTLRDSDGNLIQSGEYNLTFKIYANIGTPNALYSQSKDGVIVRDGRFSVTLTDIPNSVFTDGKDRFIGVTVEPFAEMVPRERLSSVPYAVQADMANEAVLGAIPVGGVVDWFPPQANSPLPEGYSLCDGSTVEGVQLPNLNGRFAYGTTNPANVGQTGGAATHTHSVVIPAHSHTYDVSHDHGLFNATTDAIPAAAYFGFAAGNEPGASEAAAYWHQHNVPVDIPAYTEDLRTTGEAGGATVDSAAASSLPPYMQLLKICRYK
ncbi:MAG: hypothetical protein AAGD96_29790 [Chloroflexota bacterium]